MRRVLPSLVVLVLIATGCHHAPEGLEGPGCISGDCQTLHLVVSNQSFDIDPVAIDVAVDGVPAVTGDFEVGSQHSWHFFEIQVDAGEHVVQAQAPDEDVSREETVDVTEERWIVIDFWYYPDTTGGAEPTPRHFSIHVSDDPPMFD